MESWEGKDGRWSEGWKANLETYGPNFNRSRFSRCISSANGHPPKPALAVPHDSASKVHTGSSTYVRIHMFICRYSTDLLGNSGFL